MATPPRGAKKKKKSSSKASSKPESRSTGIDRDGWIAAALRAMRHGGLDAVSIEAIARAHGVTKGGFYWHFKSRDELLEMAVASWAARQLELIDALDLVDDPRERIDRMFDAAIRPGSHALYHQLAATAPDAGPLRDAIGRVADRQIAYAERALRDLGIAADVARARAFIWYSLYVGFAFLLLNDASRVPTTRTLRAYVDEAIAQMTTTKR